MKDFQKKLLKKDKKLTVKKMSFEHELQQLEKDISDINQVKSILAGLNSNSSRITYWYFSNKEENYVIGSNTPVKYIKCCYCWKKHPLLSTVYRSYGEQVIIQDVLYICESKFKAVSIKEDFKVKDLAFGNLENLLEKFNLIISKQPKKLF
ncbi:MAG: hypothetical protein JW791_02205 [Nanoarchaeota archaeon]|nr:hypothetical protein [Nanoarchaeota archaeon]